MTETTGTAILKWWPILAVAAVVIGAAFVGQRDIATMAGEIKGNTTAIQELENKVTVEGTTTQLAIQRLKLQQEAATKAQEEAARNQDRKLDQILNNLQGQ